MQRDFEKIEQATTVEEITTIIEEFWVGLSHAIGRSVELECENAADAERIACVIEQHQGDQLLLDMTADAISTIGDKLRTFALDAKGA